MRYMLGFFLYFMVTSTMAMTMTNGIFYTDSGKGTPLVLIHAFPTDHQLWKAQEPLANHFRLITIDLKGFGKSSAADGSAITMAEYAAEVKMILDHLHIHKAIIGGESMGGYIALAFLKKYPDSMNGLILSDTQSIADTNEIKAKREASAQDVLKNGSDNLIQGFMTQALTANADEKVRSYLLAMLQQQPINGIASALRGMALREDTSASLTEAKIPVLILTGADDASVPPQQSNDMHALLPASKLVIINNAGHLSSLEQPIQWNQAVEDMFG